MKKIVSILTLLFAVSCFAASAGDDLNNCKETEVHGGFSLAGNGVTYSTSVETCTNDDNTVREITTKTKEQKSVSTPVGGGSTSETTKKSVKQYWCSTCRYWFKEQHNH